MLRWFFSVRGRHHGGIRRYEKGGTGVRIVTLILMLALCGASFALEWWAFSFFAKNILVGILLLILAAAFVFGSAEFCTVYAVTAFRMFFWGTAEKLARKADAQGAEDRGEAEERTGEEKRARSHRGFDMFLFVLGLLLAVGVVIGAFVLGGLFFA